jgi:hypothetical protein
MLWVPQMGELMFESNMGTVGDITPGTQVTTGATSPVKGTVAECIAATAFDAYMIEVSDMAYSLPATNSQLMVDILVGAATEEVLIENLIFGQSPLVGSGGFRSYLFPLYIPAGTRIACRAAGQRVSTVSSLGINLWGGDGVPPFRVGRKVTTYGVGTVPAGTTVVPGASGAAGSHTQIVAATSENHFAVIPGWQGGDDTTKLDRAYACAIGLGAATEEELATIWRSIQTTDEVHQGPSPNWPHFTDIPASTRLTMRISNSGTNDSGSYNGCIYAVS